MAVLGEQETQGFGCLVGRSEELAVLSLAATEAAEARPVLIGITGVGGIGKTALLNAWASGLSHTALIRVTCDDSERRIAFGVLEQIVRQLARISTADAISLQIKPENDPFVAGAQLLGALGSVRGDDAVTILVDDLHLADTPSQQ